MILKLPFKYMSYAFYSVAISINSAFIYNNIEERLTILNLIQYLICDEYLIPARTETDWLWYGQDAGPVS